MAVLTPTAGNELNNVYEIATTDRVLGGELGVVNRQAQSLLNTCKYLDNRITLNTTKIATHTNQISDLYSKSVPVGSIIMVAHNGAIPGYLLCDGATYSRTTYSALFGIIGTIHGAGNGSTTFNIPDFRGRYPQGYIFLSYPVGTRLESGLPDISGAVMGKDLYAGPLQSRVTATGAFSAWNYNGYTSFGSYDGYRGSYNFGFDASRYNSIYGRSAEVRPPSIVVKYYIKY